MFEAYVTNLGMYPERGVEVGEYAMRNTSSLIIRVMCWDCMTTSENTKALTS